MEAIAARTDPKKPLTCALTATARNYVSNVLPISLNLERTKSNLIYFFSPEPRNKLFDWQNTVVRIQNPGA